ncbi:MAG: hypothetical protein QXU45_01485 [Candidatus Bathyarchaeia archaeon]
MKHSLVCILLILGGFVLCLMNFLNPYVAVRQKAVQIPYTFQVPYEAKETREEILYALNDVYVSGGYYYALPPEGVYISAGKTLILSWVADGDVRAYILTQTQFQDFKFDGVATNYEATLYAREGTISAKIRYDDVYYATLSRLILTSTVKVYQAQAKLVWEETVTKYRDEVAYRTEYVNEEYNTNLYLYLGLLLIATGIILRIVKPKILTTPK